jgi:glycerate dehydrogenase
MVLTNKVLLREPVLSQVPLLRLIALTSTGVDCVDLPYCRKRGIAVANVPGYAQRSVAEHVFMLILALRRRLTDLHQAVQTGRWQRSKSFALLDFSIRDLSGSTLGLIGYGDIARHVEELAKAFGMAILIAERKGAVQVRPGRTLFEDVLRRADIVSLHCPRTPETVGLVGAPELALMKKDALLINTARGGLVDEIALAEALRSGRLGGAGVDVLSEEPPRNGSPLLTAIPNLIVTPHVAWASEQAVTKLAEVVIGNLEAFVAGNPRNLVT